MQTVVSVNVNSRPEKDGQRFSENQFPQLEEYLKQGYKVIQVYQLAPSPNLYCFTITFVLEK